VSLVVGFGARAGADVAAGVCAVLAGAGLTAGEVAVLATLDRRADDRVRELARECGWRLVVFSAAELAGQPAPHPSPVVAAAVGTPSVAEAAALLAAGPGARLLIPKRVCTGVTVAVAC
jgi:cobalt-precorrin 5A hydrolase